jgi:hypothetical protein
MSRRSYRLFSTSGQGEGWVESPGVGPVSGPVWGPVSGPVWGPVSDLRHAPDPENRAGGGVGVIDIRPAPGSMPPARAQRRGPVLPSRRPASPPVELLSPEASHHGFRHDQPGASTAPRPSQVTSKRVDTARRGASR